ncbi:MAG: M16 family metallopeptidase [Phycisphaerae bacterium]
MNFRKTTLENGLDIIAEVNPAAASMAAGFFVRTGSRDETPAVSGVSHFLEHMVFKGTDKRSAMDVNLEFDRMGANYNAFTSEEHTVYYGAVLPDYQDSILELLADILRPALREEDFQTEKQVILSEIALYEDEPYFRLYDNLMTLHFTDHPLGNVILGTPESITNLQRDQMQAYFDKRYSPTNLTLVGVGSVDFDRFVDSAREYCCHWTPFDARRDKPDNTAAGRRKTMVDPKLSRQNIGMMSSAPAAQSDDRYAAQILSTILGDDTSSRLYYALVDRGLADEASTAYNPMDQAGIWMTMISCGPEAAGQVAEIALDEIRKFRAEGPEQAEITAAANKIASSATLKGEIPMGRLSAVGFDWVYGSNYRPLDEQIESIMSVTRQDVMRLAETYEIDKVDILSLGPAEALDI